MSDEHDATSEAHEGAADELPEDLDASAFVGPYTFPDVARRRWIGALHGLAAAGSVAGWALTGNRAMIAAAVLLALVGAYHVVAGRPQRIDETDALAAAGRAVGFPIGHASAQLTWHGLASRPRWRILLYSADEPPSKRGLVELDAVDGSVTGRLVEDNPEDWSQLT